VGHVTLLPVPADDAIGSTMGARQVLSVSSSPLAVFDVSGSMDVDALRPIARALVGR
jgi:hypothetical protein